MMSDVWHNFHALFTFTAIDFNVGQYLEYHIFRLMLHNYNLCDHNIHLIETRNMQ